MLYSLRTRVGVPDPAVLVDPSGSEAGKSPFYGQERLVQNIAAEAASIRGLIGDLGLEHLTDSAEGEVPREGPLRTYSPSSAAFSRVSATAR